tara:strand:+ start:655 stop:906 length:252 start_codon:yes stop_codon:yes gene_type:complete
MNKEYKIRVYWDLSGEANAHTLNEVSKRKYDKICKEKKIPLSEDIISVNVENHSDMSHDEIESYVSESLYKTYGYISSFWFEV